MGRETRTDEILHLQGRLNYLRQSIAYEVISMRGNRGELPDFMIEEVLPF